MCIRWWYSVFAGFLAVLIAGSALGHALERAHVHGLGQPASVALATGDGDRRAEALGRIVGAADPEAIILLEAIRAGDAFVAGDRLLVVRGGETFDAGSGERVDAGAAPRDDLVVNNRFRREIDAAIAALRLLSPDRDARLAAVKALRPPLDPDLRVLASRALAQETDPGLRAQLADLVAVSLLRSADAAERVAAVRALGSSTDPQARTLLANVLARDKDGQHAEPDADVRNAASLALRAVENRAAWSERAGLLFSGVSLGSVLLLAALGLAITYGLMGVINMAHGELMMIGAYATYVVQDAARSAGWFDAYLIAAIPAAFVSAALVGMLLERTVIRHLYGRPLETLLATWGISLLLIQGMRTLFGAQNVPVENPGWMSGGVDLMAGVVLPLNRIYIVVFAALVLVAMWLVLSRTRLGLHVRGVTQNRAMASCVGVPTARVDTLAFGLGSGVAGLAGCALSQIGNVGPDLGQAYIVDSFMVVVLGGVGQIAGTVYAALGLGFVNKALEAWSGAVLAKIAVLVFIIVFIQKRPQGLFALKGRAQEA